MRESLPPHKKVECRPTLRRPLLLGAALIVTLFGPQKARADIDWFPYTYTWNTSPRGEKELELSHVQPTSGRNWQDAVSLEYGVTDRYMIEPYIVFNKSGGFRDIPDSGQAGDADDGGGGGAGNGIFDPILNSSAYRYGGIRLEQRYRFGDYAPRKLLAAAYVEYEQIRGSKPTLENKLILQYDPDPHALLAFNLIESNPLRGAKPNWAYSFGATYRQEGRYARHWYGAEAFGSWNTNQHWVGPSAGTYLSRDIRLVGTYGRQVRGSGGDQLKVQVNYEFE